MADITLSHPPSFAEPQFLINKDEFIARSGKASRSLKGGSRLSYDLEWHNKESVLWEVYADLSGAFALDVLLMNLYTHLGKEQEAADLFMRTKAAARARMVEFRLATTTAIPKGSIIGIGKGLYPITHSIPSGNSMGILAWGLREEVRQNTRLTVNNPVGRFIGLGELPKIAWRRQKDTFGNRYGVIRTTLIEE